uniref:Riboflavin kinase n=1 Tax=Panagrolaimus sp. JU765 TaxID=591449 RepID=A0AC34PV13_9BILA
MASKFPHLFSGKVVHGFGRGGKDLDCPTANLDDDAVETFPKNIEDGVFVGFAKVDDGELYPMLMSLGNNPQYGNTKKSLEVHILHNFESDFYGSKIRVVVLDRLRDMMKFNSLDELKKTIAEDKKNGARYLEKVDFTKWNHDKFFSKL